MDTEKEIHSLSAETLALSIVVGNVLSKLALNPTLRQAIAEGFDQSADVAQTLTEHFGASASPDHTVKTIKIVEELRQMVLGKEGPPRHFV
ncbi:hypothetical protein [Bradyrhizobium sp. SZCCHNR1093]|uniref:hypothetical protein n=1 Tax=Bradyrhizobium sp. SZCCHNR1093 TaxID=3057368 RepID=UPI0028E858D9|nr:hypothetical protein [Bradyrhizobium sp. SZCCHNR1093]